MKNRISLAVTGRGRSVCLRCGVAAGPGHAGATNISSRPYAWNNVTAMAGGFIPGIVFNATQPGLAYCRTDIGSAYKWDDAAKRWVPLTDWNGVSNLQGTESIATDPDRSEPRLSCPGHVTDGPAAIFSVHGPGQDVPTDRCALPHGIQRRAAAAWVNAWRSTRTTTAFFTSAPVTTGSGSAPTPR